MDFGLFTVNVTFTHLRAIAREAEELGYSLITFPDHFVQETAEEQYDPQNLCHDPLIAAATVGEVTKKIRVGSLVCCNLFRHPAVTARAVSSLDQLTDGRAVAGLGTGWNDTEFRMTGIPLPDITTRLRMLDEALTCIRSLWTRERTSFTGEFYRFTDAVLWPKPVQKPYPPIVIGGSGSGLLRIAARHADIVNIIMEIGGSDHIRVSNISRITGDRFKKKVDFVREEALRIGRDPKSIRFSDGIFSVILADSEQAACKSLHDTGQGLGMTPEEIARSPLFLIGTPEQCVEELRRRAKEWSVDHFIFAVAGDAQMRQLAKEVLAHV